MVSLPNQAISNETILLVIKFRLGGSLRFLSHAETLKVFQRACVRVGQTSSPRRAGSPRSPLGEAEGFAGEAGIQIQHSQGFNPHPKMSLPLPRPVGVESDDELLRLNLICDMDEPQAPDYVSKILAMLSEQIPEGIELLSVSLAEPNTSFQPYSATYIITVLPEYLNGTCPPYTLGRRAIKARIERLLANKSLLVTRASGHNHRGTPGAVKEIDVRPFLKSIKLDNNSIIVQYEISPAGSIRVDEILQLLELEVGMLAAPIKRTNVQWQKT